MKSNIVFFPRPDLKINEKKIFIGNWLKEFLSSEHLANSHFIKETEYDKFSLQELKISEIRKLSDLILISLSERLNNIHNLNWSIRSWKYLIGPWLEIFISIIYDRLEIASRILEDKTISADEFCNKGKVISLITYNYKDFTSVISTPSWNEKLVFRLMYILKTKDFNTEANLENLEKKTFTQEINKLDILKYEIKNFSLKILERVFCMFNNYVFFIPNLGTKFNFIKTLFFLKQFPFFYSFNFLKNKTVKYGVNKQLRKKLILNYDYKNQKEKIIVNLIIENLPTVYLEGFKKLRDLSKNSFMPSKNNLIIVCQSVLRDNVFKFWTAEKINSGAKLVLIQHGSSYGYKKCWQNEYYEVDISDKFLSWGWKNKEKIYPVGNIGLSKKKKFKIRKNKSLLIISGLNRIFKIDNCLFDSGNLKFQKKNIQYFFDNLNYNNFKKINIREHPQGKRKFSVPFSKLFKNDNIKIDYVNINANLEQLINKHSLVITTYDSTEFYYMLSREKPCLQIFQRKYIKEEFLNFFDELYGCGILHEDGISLVKKVNLLGGNPHEWWFSNEIKEKRDYFCKKLIKTKINYKSFYQEMKSIKNQ